MRGLDPRIHRKDNFYSKVMDCRVKPGNDDAWVNIYEAWYYFFTCLLRNSIVRGQAVLAAASR